MKGELFSLSKIFTENLFRIPDYQRGYSWGERQLKDFWGDIVQLESNKNHYTGVLTLEGVNSCIYDKWNEDLWIIKSKRYNPYYVVDGQQRLTTLVVLLQVIVEKMADEDLLNYNNKDEIRKKYIYESHDAGISRSYLFGYEKDNPSYEYLKISIFNEISNSHSIAEETVYTRNLAFAKQFFFEMLDGTDIDFLGLIYERITQQFLFNIYTITSDIDVCVAFETMNNRGKPLSHLELLKNRLIYLSAKFNVNDDERTLLRYVINECWKSLYYYLGKNKERMLDDDAFLYTHFSIYLWPKIVSNFKGETVRLWYYRRDDYYKEYLLNEVFVANKVSEKNASGVFVLTVKSIYDYVSDIKSSVVLYDKIYNPIYSDLSDLEKINLERLYRLKGEELSVLLLALYRCRGDENLMIEVLCDLEKIMFISSISIYAAIKDVKGVDYSSLALDLIKDAKRLHDVAKEIKAHYQELMEKVSFSEVFASIAKGNGFYGWRGIKYFMFEYELSLLEKSKTKRERLSWESFIGENYDYDHKTVEHIYPQKVTHECWRDSYNNYNISQRNILKNSIGNLIPLSKPKNSSLRNKCFEDKKGSNKNKVGYIYGCYSEIEISQYEKWRPTEIRDRGIKLLDFMEERWGFKLGDTNTKIDMLGLSFVEQ
ncbi:MAG: DUF262 domain-containing protein [Chlorobaculum sp.]|jgi:hypothetical protein|nr:DUF262 domain-containing protein [Chlorobaculum sp.]